MLLMIFRYLIVKNFKWVFRFHTLLTFWLLFAFFIHNLSLGAHSLGRLMKWSWVDDEMWCVFFFNDSLRWNAYDRHWGDTTQSSRVSKNSKMQHSVFLFSSCFNDVCKIYPSDITTGRLLRWLNLASHSVSSREPNETHTRLRWCFVVIPLSTSQKSV